MPSTIADSQVPTAVIYGTADSVVPPEQSRAVADAAAGPVEVIAVPGADHNDRTLLDGPDIVAAVADARRGSAVRPPRLSRGTLWYGTGLSPSAKVSAELRCATGR